MANTKKTTASRKSTAKRSSQTSKPRSTAAAKKKSTGSARTKKPAAAKKTTKTTAKSTQTQQSPAFSVSPMLVGTLMLVLACILALALCHLDGVLLDGVLQLFGGLLGRGTWLFCIALCLGGIFVLSDLISVRLRCACLMVFPMLYSALLQCILYPIQRLSFPLVMQLWQDGIELNSGGVLGGVLGNGLALLLSGTGAKIVLLLLLAIDLFVVFNTTPRRLYTAITQMVKEDTEQLHESDMTVTQAAAVKNKQKRQKTRKSFFAFLRDRQGKRKAEKLRAALQQQEAVPQDEPAAAVSSQPPAQSQTQLEKLARKRRLRDVMPDLPFDSAAPAVKKTPEEVRADAFADTLWDEQPPPHSDADEPPVNSSCPAPPPQPSPQELREQLESDIQQALDFPAQTYAFPSVDLLKTAPKVSNSGVRTELQESSERLVDTLASFGIEVHIINIVRGPSVTRFELQVERGVKFSRITALSDDIALALGSYSVRIAPIPDKLAIGIEVPNKTVQMVMLRDVLSSPGFVQTQARLSVALGKDITGSAQVIDLAKMPHLLIAGTTGSGKSVCINSILISLLYKSAPEDVRLIMIDPKMVELGNYNGIPHLLVPVVTDPKKASGALSWAVGEMERRYALFAVNGVRNLEDFNRLVAQQGEPAEGQTKLEHMPQIVIVIDELADLMMVAAKEVETSICRIAQKARAAGMHLVVATQRPSADVITGIMKSNIPSRIAFAVASQVESRIILDTPGAEKLIGKGDMLYAPIGMNKPTRIQGCFVSSEEIERVIAHVKTTAVAEYSQEIMNHMERESEAGSTSDGAYNAAADEDELLPQAITIVVESGQASVSMLQRRLKLGYARAARLVDQMEQRGIVGPFEGSKPRQVLITRDEWMEIQLRQKI